MVLSVCNEGDYTEGVTLMFIEDNETFAYEPLAIDRGSVRTVDDNGFLHVKISPLTRVQVAPYYGKEIPGWQSLGLEANKI
jgi:Uncharacterized protein conserved in bacteria (DUF2213).